MWHTDNLWLLRVGVLELDSTEPLGFLGLISGFLELVNACTTQPEIFLSATLFWDQS